jgi:hypothetical protein
MPSSSLKNRFFNHNPYFNSRFNMNKHNLERSNYFLICGMASVVIYIIATIIGAYVWPDYSSMSQSVSELIAVNAPSASIVIPLFLLYSLSVFAFGSGILISAKENTALKYVAFLIIAKEILGVIATLFAPMHLRGDVKTVSDTMHIVLTAVGVLACMFPAILLSAKAFGGRFRVFSIAIILIFLICGTLAGMDGAKIAEDLPTPYAGVWERINIFSYFVWVIVLSVKLLRINQNKINSI